MTAVLEHPVAPPANATWYGHCRGCDAPIAATHWGGALYDQRCDACALDHGPEPRPWFLPAATCPTYDPPPISSTTPDSFTQIRLYGVTP